MALNSRGYIIRNRPLALVYALVLVAGVFGLVWWGTGSADARASNQPAGVGLFDPTSGFWHLRDADARSTGFFYGVPGDVPLFGDWDCDGTDTVGMYRPGNGFVYLRNTNDFGVGDREFFYGQRGDIPMVGDWNGDGCDTLAIYRGATVYLSNELKTGVAEQQFFFGVPGDKPFTGDFDGNGTTDIGLYRESTGFVYFLTVIPEGPVGETADSFFYGMAGDRIVAADWDQDQIETVGIFRPSEARFYLRNQNSLGTADVEFAFGEGAWIPVAGEFRIDAGTTTTTSLTTLPTTSSTSTTTTSLPSGPLTIMPIGDSITQGSAGWRTYRCALDGKLQDAAVAFDFVGGLNAPNGGGSYGCPDPFDQDHEGRWGKRVDEVMSDVVVSVQTRQPDIALVHLGTNDILQGQGAASTAAELQSLISSLQGAKPDITILVAQIIPCNPAGGGDPPFGSKCTSDLPALNSAIASFASLSTAQSTVIVVDMATGFSLGDLRDDVHPTANGDEVIATRWMAAIQGVI